MHNRVVARCSWKRDCRSIWSEILKIFKQWLWHMLFGSLNGKLEFYSRFSYPFVSIWSFYREIFVSLFGDEDFFRHPVNGHFSYQIDHFFG
jgi:hypothetical protein